MSDNTEQPGGGAAPRDPWAPPESRVDLGKSPADARPPAVHDQPTVTSLPGADPGTGPIPGAAGGFGPPQPAASAPPVPAPPVAPNGPGAPGGQYGYPGYPGYGGQPAWGPAPANGLGVAAMVLGIIAVVGFCMWGFGIILGILALIFGIIGRGRAKRGEATNGGMALAGIILGAVSIVISAIFLGFLIWAIANDEGGSDFEYDDPYATSLVVGATR